MDASKANIAPAVNTAAADMPMNDPAAATAASAEGDASKEKVLAKKAKKEKKSKAGKAESGKRGGFKGEKKKRPDELSILKGISKPATRRLFSQTGIPAELRLSEKTTDPIRCTIGLTTRRIVHAMVRAVIDAGRKTAYLCDSRDAVRRELPRSDTFPSA